MDICLKTHARYPEASIQDVHLSERLPSWIHSACTLSCTYQVTKPHDYYLLDLTIDGVLPITCQRCLDDVSYHYSHHSSIAICFNEERAEQLMEFMDSIVSFDDHLNLVDVVTDNLYLFAPEKPHESSDCHLKTSD